MVTCYNCGKQVPDETLICPECGALVRRYDTPQQQAPQVELGPVTPAGRPASKAGTLFFRTGQKVFVWICIIFFGFYALSCLMTGVLLTTNETYAGLMADILAQMDLDIADMYGTVDVLGIQMLLSGIFSLVECVLYIVLLVTRRRVLVTAIAIATAVILVLSFLFTGIGLLTLLYAVAAIVTYMTLRRSNPPDISPRS